MRGLPLHLLEGSGIFLLALLAGCGARSTTLDADAFADEATQPSASGSNGKDSGSGEAPGVGGAKSSGSSGTTGPGSGSTAGVAAGGTAGGSSASSGGKV